MNNSSNYEYKGSRAEIPDNTKVTLDHLPDQEERYLIKRSFNMKFENSNLNSLYYTSNQEKNFEPEKNDHHAKNTFLNCVNRDLIREIPVSPEISGIVYKITQTQDIFQISFWYFSENDINVYDFRNFVDIYEEIEKELDKLTLLSQTMREKILDSISYYSKEINTNIKHLGAAHILD